MKKAKGVLSFVISFCLMFSSATFPLYISAGASGDFADSTITHFSLNSALTYSYNTNPSQVISGSASLSVTNGGGWNWFLRSNSRLAVPTVPGTVAQITMKYRFIDSANQPTKLWFTINNGNGYYLPNTAVEWKDASKIDKNDEGGNFSVTQDGDIYTAHFKTVLDGTPNMFMEYGIVDAGVVEVDDISVQYTYPGTLSNVLQWDSMFNVGAVQAALSTDTGSVIGGNQSLVLSTANAGWQAMLFGTKKLLPTDSNIRISFKYKNLGSTMPTFDLTVNDGSNYNTSATVIWSGATVTNGNSSCQITQSGDVYNFTLSFKTDANPNMFFRIADETGAMSVALDDLTVTSNGTAIYSNDFEKIGGLYNTSAAHLLSAGSAGTAAEFTSGGTLLVTDPGAYTFPQDADAKANVMFSYHVLTQPDHFWFVVHDTGTPTKYLDVTANEWSDENHVTKNNTGSGFQITNSGGEYNNVSVSFSLDGGSGWVPEIGMAGTGDVIVDDVSFSVTFTENLEDMSVLAGSADFESNTGELFNLNSSANGAVSSSADDVIDGSYSLKGSSNIEWSEYADSDPSKLSMEANQVYTAVFRYNVESGTDASRFTFIVKPTDSGADVSTQRWVAFKEDGSIDTGWESSILSAQTRTEADGTKDMYITFVTANRTDYYIALGIHNGGAIAVDDFRLYKGICSNAGYAAVNPTPAQGPTKAGQETFEDGTGGFFTLNNTANGRISSDKGDVINGSYSLKGNSNIEWSEYADSDTSKLQLSPDRVYTAVFRYKIGAGGTDDSRYTFIVKPADSNTDVSLQRWVAFEGDGSVDTSWESGILSAKTVAEADGTKDFYVSFKTDDRTDYYIALGLHNGGDISVDDFTMFNGLCTDAGFAPANPQPIDNSPVVVMQTGFEKGTQSVFELNSSGNGQVSSDKADVINGSYTLTGTSGIEWSEYADSDPTVLKFAANQVYTAVFRYKIGAGSTNDNRYTFIVKPTDPNADANTTQCWVAFKKDGSIDTTWENNIISAQTKTEADGTKDMYVTFKTANRTDYYVAMGFHSGGSIAVDDFTLFKGICNDAGYTPAKPQPIENVVRQVASTGFENGGFDFFNKVTTGTVSYREGDVINGHYSLKGDSTQEWYEYVNSDKTRLPLNSDTIYTVSFRYKVLRSTANTDFTFIVKPADTSGTDANSTQTWVGFKADGSINTGWENRVVAAFSKTRSDGTREMYFTFETASRGDDIIALGIHNGGAIAVDDVNVYEGKCADSNLAPAVPSPFKDKELAYEDFSGSLGSTLIIPSGPASTGLADGEFISDGALSGQYSILGTSKTEWWEFAYSDMNRLHFRPSTQYTVSFRYKMLQNPTNGGFMTVLFKSAGVSDKDAGTVNRYIGIHPDGTVEPSYENGIDSCTVVKNADGTSTATVTATLGPQDDWEFVVGVRNIAPLSFACKIMIDNIAFYGRFDAAGILTNYVDKWSNINLHDDSSGWNTYERVGQDTFTDDGENRQNLDNTGKISAGWKLQEQDAKPADQMAQGSQNPVIRAIQNALGAIGTPGSTGFNIFIAILAALVLCAGGCVTFIAIRRHKNGLNA